MPIIWLSCYLRRDKEFWKFLWCASTTCLSGSVTQKCLDRQSQAICIFRNKRPRAAPYLSHYRMTLKQIAYNTHLVPSAILCRISAHPSFFCTIQLIFVSPGFHGHNPDGSHHVSLSLQYRNAESRADIITTSPHSAVLKTAQYCLREKRKKTWKSHVTGLKAPGM